MPPWISRNSRTGSGRDGFDHEQVTGDCGENSIYVEWREVPDCSPEGRLCEKLSQSADGRVPASGLFIRKDKPFSVHKLIQRFD